MTDHSQPPVEFAHLACWGRNNHGQSDAPVGTYQAIAIGSFHTCALAADGTLACWGNLHVGQPTSATATYTSIVADAKHTCVIATDGAITCWMRSPDGVHWIS